MFKRIVGTVTVLGITFSALGMGYPQEMEPRTEEIANVLGTTQATESLMEGVLVNQYRVASVQTIGEHRIEVMADSQAQLHDVAMPLVEGVVEAGKRKTALTAEELLLMQKVVSAESRGESQEAQYTVACVILNRIESPIFPDSLEGVIRQRWQFTCVENGVIENVPITDSVKQAVEKALDNNTVDEDILWFRSDCYHSFHNQAFQIDDMYFSRF